MCVCVCVMNILRRKKSAAKKKYLSHISHKNESRDDYRTYVSHTPHFTLFFHFTLSTHSDTHRVLFGTKIY